jgi:hypothetical protein
VILWALFELGVSLLSGVSGYGFLPGCICLVYVFLDNT